MSWTREKLTNELNGKTLSQSKNVLEKALSKYARDIVESSWASREYKYSEYYLAIIDSNISTKDKKSLMNALHKFGVSPNYGRYSECVTVAALKKRDISLIKYTMTLVPLKTHYEVTSFCKNRGGEKDTTFVIQLLTLVKMPLTIVKAFLYGAIQQRNMTLIKFIVEQLATDIYVPTHQKVNHAIGPAFVENDDLELLQWFEKHDYNIHESRRALLSKAYRYGANRLVKYVLEKQAETDASDVYMENVSNVAFQNGDINLLQKFSKINFRVNINTIFRSLTEKKDLFYIQVLFTRYIELEKEKAHKHHWSGKTPEGDEALFRKVHVTRFYNLSKYNLSIWQYIKDFLYKYGRPETRAKLISAGYVTGISMPAGYSNSNNENETESDDENDDENENENENENESEEAASNPIIAPHRSDESDECVPSVRAPREVEDNILSDESSEGEEE